MRGFLRIVLLLVAGSLVACRPAAVPFDGDGLHTARVRSSPLAARFRVLPAPPSCRVVRPPVVFVPALGFTGHSFVAAAADMSACRERVLVDLPGMGDEEPLHGVDADEVLAAVDDVVRSVSDRPVILVGHSIGGAIATRVAARDPAHVSSLVLVDAAVAPFGLSWWERLALHPTLWSPAFRIFGQPYLFKHLVPDVIGDTELIDPIDMRQLAHLLADGSERTVLLGYYRAFLAPPELSRTAHALARVRAPILILWGRRDGVVPPSVVPEIRRAASAPVRVLWFDDASHLLPLERPRELAEAIDQLDRSALTASGAAR